MRGWTKEEVYVQGDAYFASLIEKISAAKKFIDFEAYIFEMDALGKRIAESLEEAAKRGVRVRLLLDGFGSINLGMNQVQSLRKNGIDVQIFHRIPFIIRRVLAPSRILKFIRSQGLLRAIGRLNRRNHRKVVIIDQHLAFVGGMNVSKVHSKEFSGDNAWKDFAVCVKGAEISKLCYAFDRAWDTARHRRTLFFRQIRLHRQTRDSLVKLNDTYKKRRLYHREIVRRILKAKARVWIISPYFVPDLSLIRALRVMSWTGTDVKILLPHQSDIYLMKWVNRAFYRILLHGKLKIFEYLPSTLHGKMMLIDDWLIIGSSNRNHRSLFHDLEVDLVLTKSESLEKNGKGFSD